MKPIIFPLIMLLLTATPLFAGEITVSAAASLKEVMTELTGNFARKHPGTVFRCNFGASGTLAKQIAQGAPADLFLSANREWLDYLKGLGMLDTGTIGIFAGNELVFAGTPSGCSKSLLDLPALKRIAIGSPKSVPAGQYAMEAMSKAGIARRMSGKLVQSRDVREALLYVQRGEVDGAFVYRTDALLAGKGVKILFAVPDELHTPVEYPVALTLSGGKRAEVRDFLAYLGSPEAGRILKRLGFRVK